MNSKDLDYHSLGYHSLGYNYGYYLDKTPQNILNELKQQIDNLQSNFSKGKTYNHKLAGEIEHEYSIKPQPQTKQYIKDLSQQFENESQYMTSHHLPLSTLKFNDLWVNFQKKHEYNPIHSHVGVYSFVIWYQIPFTFEDERKYSHSPINFHGQFSFVLPRPYPKIGVNYQNLGIDKSKEGYVAIFPSSLDHIVYPFYSSNEYRITIAGNIQKTNNKLSDGNREQGDEQTQF